MCRCGGLMPNRLFVGNTKLVQVHARSTSPTAGALIARDRSSFTICTTTQRLVCEVFEHGGFVLHLRSTFLTVGARPVQLRHLHRNMESWNVSESHMKISAGHRLPPAADSAHSTSSPTRAHVRRHWAQATL